MFLIISSASFHRFSLSFLIDSKSTIVFKPATYSFINGILHGDYVLWNSDGTQKYVETYNEGILIKKRLYQKNPDTYLDLYYNQQKLIYKVHKFVDSVSDVIDEFIYYPNNSVREIITIHAKEKNIGDGLIISKSLFIFNKDTLYLKMNTMNTINTYNDMEKIMLTDSNFTGHAYILKFYNSENKLLEIRSMKNNISHGPCIRYYPNGNKEIEFNFYNNNLLPAIE